MQFNTCWGNSLSALYLKRFLTFLFVVTGVPLALGLGAAVLALYLALLFPVMIPACVSCTRASRFAPYALDLSSRSYSVTFGAASIMPAGLTASAISSCTR